MKRKVIVFLLAAMLLNLLSACGTSITAAENEPTPEPSVDVETTQNVEDAEQLIEEPVEGPEEEALTETAPEVQYREIIPGKVKGNVYESKDLGIALELSPLDLDDHMDWAIDAWVEEKLFNGPDITSEKIDEALKSGIGYIDCCLATEGNRESIEIVYSPTTYATLEDYYGGDLSDTPVFTLGKRDWVASDEAFDAGDGWWISRIYNSIDDGILVYIWIQVIASDADQANAAIERYSTAFYPLDEEEPAAPSTESEELTPEQQDFYEALRLYYEERDYKGAYRLLREYREPTIGAMAAFMGDCNYKGKGTAENNAEAYRLYSLAADLGCGLGYYGKGMCTLYGYGTHKDEEAAEKMFRAALRLLPEEFESASDPHVKGLTAFRWGRIYYYGLNDGFPDYDKALEHLKTAGEYFDPDALGLLGQHYFQNGDYKTALPYYVEAADHGSELGAEMAGKMYLYGDGAEKNGDLAVKYLQMAIDWGTSGLSKYLKEAKQLLKEQQEASSGSN